MDHKIKIAVIGGTGKSGKFLVQELITQGFPLRLLLRNPASFQTTEPLVEVVPGNVTDYAAVNKLLEGCQAVISMLGLGIPASEPTIFSLSTTHVLRAMQAWGIQRYIVTTGLNVDTPFDNKTGKTALATDWMKNTYPVSTANKQLEYELLASSSVDWTLVRLPMIGLTAERSGIAVSLTDCPGDAIHAGNLANFLIEQLFATTCVKKSPFIANV
ncbi:epimerase [Niastella yeongjuensis]|uniref:Epimerase n=1 Tax=Niastella yeongjuensis TaxID=354355 RepID=A0A1V9EU93_9BACT|nr:NAD(P)H-binding protein [Niastella yeongjuensis]OQP49733.1 epimerase [Niastella yeongjuensis]SEP40761.1 Putative NADH-flavin reductase [Niastella yeongjuensis]